MCKVLLAFLILSPLAATAADYNLFYLVGSKRVSAEEAIIAEIKGENVFKCQSVETKVSKAGTSISLKNVKKPKTETKD